MSDGAFQWGLTAATVLVVVWIAIGIALLRLPVLVAVVSGIVVEFGAGIPLVRYWGKNYMGRR